MNQAQARSPDPGLIIGNQIPDATRWKVVFWMIMVYLLMPLLTFISWGLGLKIAWSEAQTVEFFTGGPSSGRTFLLVVIAMGLTLKGWSMYNYARFARAGRRRDRTPLGPKELSEDFEKAFEAYEIHTDALADWQETPYISLQFDPASGHILAVRPLETSQTTTTPEPTETVYVEVDTDQAQPGLAAPPESTQITESETTDNRETSS